jgi:hypothetical protein
MNLRVKDGSPDGMHVQYRTYVMTWDELKDFIDYVAKWENRERIKKGFGCVETVNEADLDNGEK